MGARLRLKLARKAQQRCKRNKAAASGAEMAAFGPPRQKKILLKLTRVSYFFITFVGENYKSTGVVSTSASGLRL